MSSAPRKTRTRWWHTVCRTSVTRVYALDALAYIEALLGRRKHFEDRLEAVDETAWRSGPPFMVSELLLYRGKAYGLLGDIELAERWLTEAKTHSEEHGNNQISFQAEAALEALSAGEFAAEDASAPTEPVTPRRHRRSPQRAERYAGPAGLDGGGAGYVALAVTARVVPVAPGVMPIASRIMLLAQAISGGAV